MTKEDAFLYENFSCTFFQSLIRRLFTKTFVNRFEKKWQRYQQSLKTKN